MQLGVGVVAAACLVGSAGADVLLAQFNHATAEPGYLGGWGSTPPPEQSADYRLMLAFAPATGTGPVPGLVRTCVTVINGLAPPGYYEYSPANETNWATIQSMLTNGYNNACNSHLERSIPTPNTPFAPSMVNGENQCGFNQTVLYQAQLTRVRLRFDGIVFTPDGTGGGVMATGTWEIWGTPVPSPGSGLVLLVGVAVLRRRARHR